MGANPRDDRARPVPFRWLIVVAIWFLAFGPILICTLIGLIFAGTTGALVGAVVGILIGVASYLAGKRALKRAERR